MRNHHVIPSLTETQVSQFWAKVDKRGPDECWKWTGGVTKANHSQNYGIWHINNSTMHLRPHRVAYTLLVGPINWPLTLDHVAGRCSSTLCCNPSHLEPVTQGANVQRYYAARTHCNRGHEITERGHHCRPCANLKTKERRDAERAAKKSVVITDRPMAALIKETL